MCPAIKNITLETCGRLDNAIMLSDIRRLGTRPIYTLVTTTVIIFGLCGHLAYLWLGQVNSGPWKRIIVNRRTIRSVAVIVLALRTAICLQAATGSAIIASLLLKSRPGIKFQHLPTVSPIHTGTTSLWTLARCAYEDLWGSFATHRHSNYRYCIAEQFLVIKTSIIQFSFTVLLSDLRWGPLVGYEYDSQVPPGLSYSISRAAEKIPVILHGQAIRLSI